MNPHVGSSGAALRDTQPNEGKTDRQWNLLPDSWVRMYSQSLTVKEHSPQAEHGANTKSP